MLVALLLVAVACEPPCLRGHNETRHFPMFCHLDPVTIGDFTFYLTTCDPPYDAPVFVCDQYELEKAPER